MTILNLKRLSIDDLNSLAAEIIDELSNRENNENYVDKTNFESQIYSLNKNIYSFEKELYKLRHQKKLLNDEIERVEEKIEDILDEGYNLFHEYNIGMIH